MAMDMAGSQAVVIGDLEIARRTVIALEKRGACVVHLLRPTEAELCTALVGDVSAVAVLVRGDVTALRYALHVEHLRPNVRLVVTLFDRTVSEQLMLAVPNCRVTSPADVAVPSVIGACLGGAIAAVHHGADGPVVTSHGVDGPVVSTWPSYRPRWRSVADSVFGQLRPYDVTTRILLGGLTGLLVVLGLDWLITTTALHTPPLDALYVATRVIATVGPGDAAAQAPPWYLAFASASMLATIGLTALFTAGVVNRLRSSRSVGLVGARTIPIRDHIVVVGLGQVGLRLCIQLRHLGIPVVAVERDPRAVNLRLAKQARVPVLIAHAEDRATLRKLGLHRARALAAMGSEDLGNVEIAIAARAICPGLRIVLRAGESDVIAETRSLFHLGAPIDVSALTALAVTMDLVGEDWELVYHADDEILVQRLPACAEAQPDMSV